MSQANQPSSSASERRPRRVPIAAVAGMVAAIAVAAIGVSRTQRHDPGSSVSYDRGTGHLTFSLARFSGEQLNSAALLGRPVVVNFYASWCGVCRSEMPQFEALHRDAIGRVAVVGVNPQSNDDDAAQAALVQDTGVTYPTVRDPNDRLLRIFDPSGALPVTVFLDQTGRVKRVVNGELTEGQLVRILAADFGLVVTRTTPDRAGIRTAPPAPRAVRSGR